MHSYSSGCRSTSRWISIVLRSLQSEFSFYFCKYSSSTLFTGIPLKPATLPCNIWIKISRNVKNAKSFNYHNPATSLFLLAPTSLVVFFDKLLWRLTEQSIKKVVSEKKNVQNFLIYTVVRKKSKKIKFNIFQVSWKKSCLCINFFNFHSNYSELHTSSNGKKYHEWCRRVNSHTSPK